MSDAPKNASVDVERLVLFEDEPVPGHAVDELQLRAFSEVVAGTALGTKGPFTIGVFADWGQGKTSVLRQAKSLIEAQPGVADTICIWFNAWQFEKEEHPIVPLVATIVAGIERELAAHATELGRAPERREAMTAVARALRSVAYGFSAKATVKVPGLAEIEAGFVAKEMIDRYDKLRGGSDPLLDRSLYYDAFERLAESARLPEHPKVVVFIDDLDRCMPDTGLALLESIKLILSQPGFIFVLAIDRRIIEGYLRKRYRTDYGVEDYDVDGTSYLDKIVQLPLGLPPHRARFRSYVEGLLARERFLASNAEVAEALKGMTSLLAAGSAYNPRSLVRFVNNLIVDRRIRALSELTVEVDDLKLCAVSRIFRQQLQDSLYRALVRNDEWCKRLADSGLERGHDSDPSPILTKIIDRLSAIETSGELLEIDAVRSWLTEHERRIAVDGFLVAERQVEGDDDWLRGYNGLFETVPRALLSNPDALMEEVERQAGAWEPTNLDQVPPDFAGYFVYARRTEQADVAWGSLLTGSRWENDSVPLMKLVHGAAASAETYQGLSWLTFLGREWDEGFLDLSDHMLGSTRPPEHWIRTQRARLVAP